MTILNYLLTALSDALRFWFKGAGAVLGIYCAVKLLFLLGVLPLTEPGL